MIVSGGTTTLGVYDFKAGLDEFGKVDYWSAVSGGHPLNKRVMLLTGEIVQSTIPANTNNPNSDMTGWLNVGNDGIVESIAGLLSVSNPKNGQVVYVKSYHAGLNKGGGTFVYDSNKSAFNDGVSVFNGWVRVKQEDITPFSAGAVGDGITDDRQAFQDALDYLSSGGGGTLIVPDGEYLLNSKTNKTGVNADTLVLLRPNVSIVGLGPQSKIKVGSFLNKKFYCFYNHTESLGNISVANLFIDANGQGNLPESNYGYDQWVIATGRANQVQIENVNVVNAGGQQVFSLGTNEQLPTVKSAMITHCRVYKTGRDIAGNIQGDHSSFYVAAEFATITGNTLSNDNESLTSTAIECHSHNQVVTGNNILNFNVGVITAATVRSLNSVLIANNNIKARKAWHLWVYNNFDIRDIIFAQNNCTFATLDGAGFLDTATQVVTPISGTVSIIGNNIIGDKREISAEGFYGIYIGDIENISIKNNSFQGVIGRSIEFGGITSVGKVSVDIEGNTFNDCNSTTNALYKECIAFNTLTSIKRLSIKRNTCVSQSSAFSHKILSGVCTVGEFEFIDNSEVGSGFTQQPTWIAAKFTNSKVHHSTNVSGRPTMPASLGSTFKVGSSEYKRVKDNGVHALWNAVHYTATGKPTTYDSFHGDIAINMLPAVGQPPEWRCVGDGNPGTWAAMANLVAVT